MIYKSKTKRPRIYIWAAIIHCLYVRKTPYVT